MLTKETSGAFSDSVQSAQGGVLIGKLVSINVCGNPMIAYDEKTAIQPVEALTTVPLTRTEIGQDVAISFAQNQNGSVIVMGVIRRVLDDVINFTSDNKPTSGLIEKSDDLKNADIKSEVANDTPEVLVNGNKLEISAADEITLRCGKASITLNKQGKILIKGEHMLNRMSGAYKIKSGSIQLN